MQSIDNASIRKKAHLKYHTQDISRFLYATIYKGCLWCQIMIFNNTTKKGECN